MFGAVQNPMESSLACGTERRISRKLTNFLLGAISCLSRPRDALENGVEVLANVIGFVAFRCDE